MAETVNQPDWKPTRKVTYGTLGTAAAAIVIFVLTQTLGLEFPGEVSAALSLLIGSGVGGAIAYWIPEWAPPEEKPSG